MKNYDLIVHPLNEHQKTRRAELVGTLDSHTVINFERSVDELVAEGTEKVLLDLQNLSYISSAGISALMGLTHRLRQREGELILLRPSEKVHRVFRTLGFTNIFRIVEDPSEIDAII